MSVVFWILAALIAVLGGAFVAWPLLRGSSGGFSREARRIQRQLATLRRAHEDGHLGQGAFEERRQALRAELDRLLEAPAAPRPALAVSLATALLVPLGAGLVYWLVGNPAALDAGRGGPGNTAAAAPGEAGAPVLSQAIAQLEQRLAQNPDDVEGWWLLGQSYMSTGRYEDARDAFGRARELAPEEPAILEMYASAVAFAAGTDQLPQEAAELFRQALERNPESQRSLYFLGMAAFRRDAYREALDYWERLAALLQPDSPPARQLAEDMAAARAALGETPQVAALFPEAEAAAEAPAPAPAGEESSAGLTVEVTLDASLREQVSPSDVLFVFARAADGPRMPLAIQRLAAGQLPVKVRLDASMAMSPALSLASFPEVVVGARISKSGTAAPRPGDLEALSEPVPNDFGEIIQLNIARVL